MFEVGRSYKFRILNEEFSGKIVEIALPFIKVEPVGGG